MANRGMHHVHDDWKGVDLVAKVKRLQLANDERDPLTASSGRCRGYMRKQSLQRTKST